MGDFHKIQRGDIIFIDWEDDGEVKPTHTEIVTDTSPTNIFISQHTNNRRNLPWYDDGPGTSEQELTNNFSAINTMWVFHPEPKY